jgi:hypothetical protein
MANGSKPMSEKDWQAQMDCETIASAAVIQADSQRLAAAQKMAEKMATQKKEQLDRMQMEHKALSGLANKPKPKPKVAKKK